METLRVGMLGAGTVGSGVARILLEEPDRIVRRCGRRIELTRAVVRDPLKARDEVFSRVPVSGNPRDVLDAAEVDVVLELMGGLEPARTLVRSALQAGKDVVTANKALLCEHGEELFSAAREAGRTIAFEAAVAGGVPIIHVLGQSMAANQITAIEAIINGTSNFILTDMFRNDAAYDDAVRKAQAMGYAEADPSMDVEGTDAAQKLTLLTLLAFGTRTRPEQFQVQGINTLELADLKYADELGYAVKLLATAKLLEGGLEMHTQPTLIRQGRPLATVEGANNMIALTGDVVGQTWFSGMGAGQMATASAVVSDLIDVAVGRAQLTFPHLDVWGAHAPVPLQPAEQAFRRYYLRFNVEDRPHVIADITDILGRNSISLASVIQHEAPEPDDVPSGAAPIVPLVIMTHRTTEGQLRRASAELDALNCLRRPKVCLPVSD
ncbi:MAG: homoserine dehydrogenase [Planctomyces sp.]|nr:homoserine dehydrogenase [Planctomyces sp.]